MAGIRLRRPLCEGGPRPLCQAVLFLADDWVAIILEKIEYERKGPDGKTEKEYAAWVTRDGWRRVSSDEWVILFSEEVGQEHWKGTPPPLANW